MAILVQSSLVSILYICTAERMDVVSLRDLTDLLSDTFSQQAVDIRLLSGLFFLQMIVTVFLFLFFL